jgi:hypothetical protein
MSIRLTCGHKAEEVDQDQTAIVKGYEVTDQGWSKAIYYQSICSACKEDYRKEGNLFESDKEAILWLTSKEN